MDNFAYIVSAFRGLRIYDISDLGNPEEAGYLVCGDYAYNLAVDNDGLIYVADGEGGVLIVRFDEPSSVPQNNIVEIPSQFVLQQNFPNPFNPSTRIKYTLRKSNHIVLNIYNLSGQEVATLVNEFQPAGEYQITWQPKGLPSGLYFYKLQAGETSITKKLILQK